MEYLVFTLSFAYMTFDIFIEFASPLLVTVQTYKNKTKTTAEHDYHLGTGSLGTSLEILIFQIQDVKKASFSKFLIRNI